MSVFCQSIFRLSACGDAQAGGISGRITMTHRPQSLDDCAPTLLHHPISMSLRKQGFVEPLFIPSLNMSLRKQGADGLYGLSDKTDESHVGKEPCDRRRNYGA